MRGKSHRSESRLTETIHCSVEEADQVIPHAMYDRE